MGQVTIYLDNEIEIKMTAAAKASQQSKSKWIAGLIQEKVSDEWPESITALAGAWKEFPSIDELRATPGQDVNREKL
jgi:hypothetical protein